MAGPTPDFLEILRLLTRHRVNFVVVGGTAQPEKKLKPSASHLASRGHQLLMTSFGPLDVLGFIGNGHEDEELLACSTEFPVGGGVIVHVLNLETLIQTKEETAGEKDLAVLPLLRRTLDEKSRKSS